MQWYHVDLHNHTPASADYQEPGISFIHILRKAEQAGVDILAFTDHNTVAGYATMMQEIDRLVFLEQLGRAHADDCVCCRIPPPA
jgi:predicted metal-dependent phosphoesterase TrpH